MAGRALALTVAAALGLLTLGPLVMVLARAGGAAGLGPADWAAVRFTLLQAALSAGVSVALAIPVARALARRRFVGRGALIALLGAPFLLPVIVAVLGLLAVFGRAGLVNRGIEALGLPPVPIYGLHGVVLAHVFFNMPLAVRLILQGWFAIPAERFRLAATLGFGPSEVARHLERPMLREVVPGALAVVFVICLSSFAVALTLGGGPRATTVELAIYQALRFQFDLGRTAMLAAVQVGLCAAAVLAAGAFALPSGFGAGLDRAPVPLAPRGWRRLADGLAIAAAAAFLILPLGMVAARGLPGLFNLPAEVWPALGRSFAVALPSAVLSVGGAMTLALASPRFGLVATLPLAVSSLVLGTGLFLVAHPFVNPERLALAVTMLVNATLSLPFAYRILAPEARALQADFGRLAETLDLRGLARLRWLILPRLRRPLGFSLGVSAALAMGDLGVIALFADEGGATLPLLVQRLMGAYRMEQAAGAALVLVLASFSLFWLFDRGGRHASS